MQVRKLGIMGTLKGEYDLFERGSDSIPFMFVYSRR